MAMERVEIPDSFFKELGLSREVEGAVVDIASQVVTVAQATAPEDTGDYKRGIKVEVRRGKRRVVARAVATDSKSMLMEALTGNLQRAGRSVKR